MSVKVKPGTFEKRYTEFKVELDTPLNILRSESVKTEVVKGEKVKIRRPGGEEVLRKSGILSWQEDLIHLRNQLTREQQGTCHGFDKRQQMRDDRSMNEKMVKDEKRKAEEEWEAARKKVQQEDEDDGVVEAEYDLDEEFVVTKKSTVRKVNVMSHISGTADRLNLSVRKRAMMAASTSNAVGMVVV